jgi:hypothetical protein
MNLIDFAYLTLSIVCAGFFGNYLAQRWGVVGWLVGAPLGLLLPRFGLRAVLRVFNRNRSNRENAGLDRTPDGRSGDSG